jgi:ABC-type glycerol-3-phosphate transport system substrate-binding protein
MRALVIVSAMALMLTACSGDDGEEATTTLADGVTTMAPSPNPAQTTSARVVATSEAPPNETTIPSTSGPPPGLPVYEIAFRGDGGDGGDTVVIVLDPASYSSLSDIDLQDVIRDVYDEFPPVAVAHVVDSDDAVSLVVAERNSLTEEELTFLEEHYFARLEDGIRIIYVGPFDEYPIAILGS